MAAGDAQEAAGYLALAVRLTNPPAPTLTITCGLSGCGKTYLTSRRLASADFLHTVRIRSDVERKRLFGLAPDAASGGTIYTPEATARTYARLAELAESILAAGWSVIVDAAFLKRAERDDVSCAGKHDWACRLPFWRPLHPLMNLPGVSGPARTTPRKRRSPCWRSNFSGLNPSARMNRR